MRCTGYLCSILLAGQLCLARVQIYDPPSIDYVKNQAKNAAVNNRRKINWKGQAAEMAMKAVVKEPKYFREPGTAEAGHYDKRFYMGVVTDEERKSSLTHLIRAWLQWTQAEGIETWLAHGTLLGWWWNSKTLPWDTDLDVQISELTLKHLALDFNMTTWSYKFEQENFSRDYLLDINPNWVIRTRGLSSNLIDGRWIDKSTGLFIDITGLSEVNGLNRPGVISCKNMHRYKIEEIYPLEITEFEGFKAYVPNAYERILIKEYRSRALTLTQIEEHEWQPALDQWVPMTRFEPTIPYQLRTGKTMQVKIQDPKGLEAVPRPTFLQNIWRLLSYC